MNILSVDSYLDGGTVEITTDECVYCIDGRLNSNTIGYLYEDYPLKDNSNLIKDSEKIFSSILSYVEYNDEYYYNEIIQLYNKRK